MRTTLRVGQLMGSSSLPVQGPAHIPFKQVTLACTLKVQGRTEPWTWLPAAREHRGDCSRGSTASNQLALTCHDFYAKLVTSQNAACCRCCFLIIGCMTYTNAWPFNWPYYATPLSYSNTTISLWSPDLFRQLRNILRRETPQFKWMHEKICYVI